MKFRAPMYYKQFKCIGEKCKHNCCLAGWEIEIDDKTAEFYRSVSGDFGDKLRDCIDFGSFVKSNRQFISSDNDQPDKSECNDTNNLTNINTCNHFILNKDGSCPFLNQHGLCDIIINLGEDKLCQICTEHPRYYEWFKGVKEAGVGLCCEEAGRIILSNTAPFSTYEVDVDDEDCDEYDDEIYEYLCKCRDKITRYLDCDELDLMDKIKNVLWYGNMIQLDLDSGLLDDEDIVEVESYDGCSKDNTFNNKLNYEKIIKFLCNLEPNNENWIPYLENCLGVYLHYDNNICAFEKACPEVTTYLKNIAIYFVWRYFLKGVFDGDVICKLKLMYVSVMVARWLMYCHWLEFGGIDLDTCIDIARRYSEEIEYSDENLDRFFDKCYEGDCFDVESLINMK